MKIKLFKIVLPFLGCLTLNAIAQEPCLIHDDNCIHYSERQDIRCLDCLMNEPCKDELIVIKDSIIVKQQMFIDYTDNAIKELNSELVKTELALAIMRKKRKNAFIMGGITSLTGIITTFFLIR